MEEYERGIFLKNLPKEDLISILARTEQENKGIREDNNRLYKENKYMRSKLSATIY